MVGFLRTLKLAGLLAAAAGLVLLVSMLDRVLGTAHFVLGLAIGLVVGVGGGLGFLVYSHRQAMKKLPLRQPPMQTQQLASFDWTVTALDGSPFPMDHLRGEPMVLNIWSTMCAPCVAELPSIERLHKAVDRNGVKVLCVATDRDVNTVREFVAAKGFQLPVYVLGESEIPQVFDSDYIPATYVVNPDGHIIYQHTGAALWDHPRVISLLRGLVLQHAVAPLNDQAVA